MNDQFVDPQLGAVGCESGDIFLLCTDGLVEGLYDHHVVEILREKSKSRQSRADRAQRLVKEAVEKSGRDNTTALVIEVVSERQPGGLTEISRGSTKETPGQSA